MNDGSRRFVLKGGKYDSRGKKLGGFKLRVYANARRWDGTKFVFDFDDEVTYDGEVYGYPETQHPNVPYLVFLRMCQPT